MTAPGRRHRLALGLAAVLLLAACSNGPEQGAVVTSDYDEPLMYLILVCTGPPASTCIGVPSWTAETWNLYLRNEEARGWRSVSRAAFDQCPTGSHYPECAGGK